jgi:hypothetical protein
MKLRAGGQGVLLNPSRLAHARPGPVLVPGTSSGRAQPPGPGAISCRPVSCSSGAAGWCRRGLGTYESAVRGQESSAA